MTSRYLNLLFSPAVKAVQQVNGSRDACAKRDGASEPDVLTENEAQFIATRDSFYMASVGASGWPSVQHRGGPVGFLRVLGERTIGFADFRGNRLYVSVGNFADDNRGDVARGTEPGDSGLCYERLDGVGHANAPACRHALDHGPPAVGHDRTRQHAVDGYRAREAAIGECLGECHDGSIDRAHCSERGLGLQL